MDAGEVLITGVVSLLSVFVGIAGAGAAQDRDRMIKERGIAKTLLTDLDRIERFLNDLRELSALEQVRSLANSLPHIHPWIEGQIAQIGDADPEIFAGYMDLQSALTATRKAVSATEEAERSTLQAAARVEIAENEWLESMAVVHMHGLPAPRNATEEVFARDEARLIELSDHPHRPTATLAAAQLEWWRWKQSLEYVWSVMRRRPDEALLITGVLRRRLAPIALRVVPTVPALMLLRWGRASEDRAVQQLADDAAVREYERRRVRTFPDTK